MYFLCFLLLPFKNDVSSEVISKVEREKAINIMMKITSLHSNSWVQILPLAVDGWLWARYVWLFRLFRLSRCFPLDHLHPAVPHFCSQFPHYCPCPWVLSISSLTNPFSFHHYAPPGSPPGHFQPVPWFYASGSILFVSLFCSLDSSYRWDQMVFVFHQLAYFT